MKNPYPYISDDEYNRFLGPFWPRIAILLVMVGMMAVGCYELQLLFGL